MLTLTVLLHVKRVIEGLKYIIIRDYTKAAIHVGLLLFIQ